MKTSNSLSAESFLASNARVYEERLLARDSETALSDDAGDGGGELGGVVPDDFSSDDGGGGDNLRVQHAAREP